MIVLSLQVLGLLQGALQHQLLLLLPVICITGTQLMHHFPDDLRRPAQLGITASPGAPRLPPRPVWPRIPHDVQPLFPRAGSGRRSVVTVTEDGGTRVPGLRGGGGQPGGGERTKAAACLCSLTFLVMILP